ncbi:hypothetical protein B9Z55_016998 [Caenorhabditis nigoni]|uniref:SXP/RAL-2 family protein Ani s 5-like cation-binding domain-containing protein n=1 Tax=Caenorhabditis nigoni TaxID=1611254 RepID=A0A2G5T7J1_9PELO|nr:hypothetical protein B9Z55_016998 [Caenorhabditis nigoni]
MNSLVILTVLFCLSTQDPLEFGPKSSEPGVVLENVNAVVANFTEVYEKLDSIVFNATQDQESQIRRLAQTFPREVRALLFIARHYRPEDKSLIFESEEPSNLNGPVQKEIVMENVKAVVSNITEVYSKLESILTDLKLTSEEKKSQIQRLSETFPREVRVLYFIACHYRPEDTTPVFKMMNGEETWKTVLGLTTQKNLGSAKFKRNMN